MLALRLEFSSHLIHLDVATGMQAFFPAPEPMEPLETPYKSHLLYRDLQPLRGSFHFMILLKPVVEETFSNTQGLSILYLCQVNEGSGLLRPELFTGEGLSSPSQKSSSYSSHQRTAVLQMRSLCSEGVTLNSSCTYYS